MRTISPETQPGWMQQREQSRGNLLSTPALPELLNTASRQSLFSQPQSAISPSQTFLHLLRGGGEDRHRKLEEKPTCIYHPVQPKVNKSHRSLSGKGVLSGDVQEPRLRHRPGSPPRPPTTARKARPRGAMSGGSEGRRAPPAPRIPPRPPLRARGAAAARRRGALTVRGMDAVGAPRRAEKTSNLGVARENK